MACRAPTCWLKYTTQVIQLNIILIDRKSQFVLFRKTIKAKVGRAKYFSTSNLLSPEARTSIRVTAYLF